MAYRAPVRDQLFVLRDVLGIEHYANLPGFADAPLDLIEQILTEGARFCEEVLAPINHAGDKEGCVWSADNTVRTPTGFKAAYHAMVEAGWPSLGADVAYGGQGLPRVLSLAYSEMSSSANMAFSMYPGLTHGAYSAISEGGTDEQKNLYLPKLASAQWGGTMNLTEPQCGTDLGLLRTKAVPRADGTYQITGQKIWISGGEHDLAENIVHLVLARIEGAPAGTRGISLFIAPKFLPNPDGSVGPRNEGVKCVGLEEKMGIHGNATCVMAYEDAIGWLIGEANAGLRLMFVMMNEARLGVGVQGLAQGDLHLTCRMLMDSKATLEGGRAFLLGGLQGDLLHLAPDEGGREERSDYMEPDDPGAEGLVDRQGAKICSDAMQVHGGSGFTEHFRPAGSPARCAHQPDLRGDQWHPGAGPGRAASWASMAAGAVLGFFGEVDAFAAATRAIGGLGPSSMVWWRSRRSCRTAPCG